MAAGRIARSPDLQHNRLVERRIVGELEMRRGTVGPAALSPADGADAEAAEVGVPERQRRRYTMSEGAGNEHRDFVRGPNIDRRPVATVVGRAGGGIGEKGQAA